VRIEHGRRSHASDVFPFWPPVRPAQLDGSARHACDASLSSHTTRGGYGPSQRDVPTDSAPPPMTGDVPPNQIGGGDGGKDQHGRPTRGACGGEIVFGNIPAEAMRP
jgi:hypothetical protein